MTDHNKEFVDTNILVYAYNESDKRKQEKAKTLLIGLWNTGTGCLSVQVFQEFYTIVTRKLTLPLPVETVMIIIEDLSAWEYHIPDANDVLAAINIQQSYQLSFWDAMIIRSASKLGCNLIWSEDLNHGQSYEGIKVINPFMDD